MTKERDRMRKLALSYEDLTPDERARVDAQLEWDATLRRELAQLREVEARARDPFDLATAGAEIDPLPDFPLSPAEQLQESTSRARLLQRVGPAAKPRVRRAKVLPFLVPMAAAAVLALAIWGPWTEPTSSVVQGLGLEPVQSSMGPSRGTGPSDSKWRTGDAFTLVFTLEREARVVVYHVDPLGEVALAYPERPDAITPLLPAGQELHLPSDDAAESWVFSGRTGPESFLVATVEDDDMGLTEIDLQIRQEILGVSGRIDRLERLMGLMKEHIGPTKRIDADHID